MGEILKLDDYRLEAPQEVHSSNQEILDNMIKNLDQLLKSIESNSIKPDAKS